VNRAEYLARPEAVKAIEELAEACFAVRERGEGEDAFPDATGFLRERGVEPPGDGTIQVRHTIEEPGTTVAALAQVEPAKYKCPDGNGDCWPTNCKMIRGQWVCAWVCDCH